MLLIFDFDGTLADTHLAFKRAFDEAATILNVQAFRQQEEAHLRTLEARDVLRAHGIASEQVSDFTRLLKTGMENRKTQVRLVPGIAEALAELSMTETSLGLITSNSEELVRSVLAEQVSLFEYQRFDVPINGKSSALTHAQLAYGIPVSLHYVGDEIRDFRAAKEAGVGFSAVTWGYNTEASLYREGCESFIRDPSELAHAALYAELSQP